MQPPCRLEEVNRGIVRHRGAARGVERLANGLGFGHSRRRELRARKNAVPDRATRRTEARSIA